MRRFLSCALLLALAAGAPLAAQQRPPLESRLDAQTLAALRPMLEAARREGLPVRALEDKALEGAAKRVPPPRILAAVEQLAIELREVRTVLREAAPNAALADGEIVAAAVARREGAPAAELAALRRSAPPNASLEIPFALLGELVVRGIPADEARRVIEHMLAAGVSQEQFVLIPDRVDAALRVGAPPGAALGSALAGLGIPPPPAPGPVPVPRPEAGRPPSPVEL